MMPIGRDFCKAVQTVVRPKTVVEVGSRPAEGQEELANLRTIFTDATRYVGTDMESGVGVDLVLDVCGKIPIVWQLKEFELCVCTDMLEHCRYPERAVENMGAVAQHLALRTAFCAPIHMHPDDFWRFTPSVLLEIVSDSYPYGFVAQDHPVVAVPENEMYDWPHGVYAFGTLKEETRNDVIRELQKLPGNGIMVTRSW